MGYWFTYGLLFAALLAVLWVVWTMIDAAGRAEEVKLDLEKNVGADGRQKTPLERMVSPGRLFRLQLVFAVLPAALVPGCFMFAGIAEPLFLAVFSGAAAFAGWKITRLYFVHRVRRRQATFEEKILDLTAGLASALKAGMALPQALDRVAVRMTGPMREELAIVVNDTRLKFSIPAALDRMVERMPCEDARLLASSVRLTSETGGSLAEVLEEMTDMIRRRREFADRVKSLTAQGRFEGYALGAMPVVAFTVFYLIRPEIMGVLFTSIAGWTAIGVVIVMETIGFMVISRITDIKV